MLTPVRLVAIIALSTTACVGAQPEPGEAAFDPRATRLVSSVPTLTKQPVALPLRVDGTYRVVARWDLTSAIAGDSLGDTLATLLIAEAAGALGLPSWWEDDAEAALSSLAHDPLADFIDANTPDVVGGSDGLLAKLGDILGNVEVVSQLSLGSNADGTVSGSEQITAVRLHYAGQSVEVPVAELASAAGAGTIESSFVATREGRDRLSVEPHAIVLKSDPLAAFGLDGLLSITDIAAYAEQVIDCNAAVSALTGGNGLSISFAGQSISISNGTLVSACEAVRAEALELVLGFYQTELGVSTGGPLLLQDDTGDRNVDRLFAAAGYTGVIESLPESLQAPFAIELTGTRE